jgi:hypothetical protein
VRLTLHLSGGLRAVQGDLPERLEVELEHPARVREILARAGINPLLVMMVAFNGDKIDKDSFIHQGGEMVVVGPAAGG